MSCLSINYQVATCLECGGCTWAGLFGNITLAYKIRVQGYVYSPPPFLPCPSTHSLYNVSMYIVFSTLII